MSEVSLKEGRYYLNNKSARQWCILQDGQEITGNYITFDDLQATHPNGGYKIVGEVLRSEDVHKAQVLNVDTDSGITLPVNPVGFYSAKSYKNIGYIPCGENSYIAFYQKKGAAAVLIPFLLIPFFILGVLLALWYRPSQDPMAGATIPGTKFQIDSSITDYEGQLTRPADMEQTQILIPGFSTLYMREGTKEVNVFLFNPDENPCFFQFNVVDKTTGEILYESQLVPPGKGIEGISLNRTYSEGEYPVVIEFKTHDLEDPNINYNGSNMEVGLVVVK